MEKIILNNIEIAIQPEVAEYALKNKVSSSYICWLVAKELDKIIGEGGGKVKTTELIKSLTFITGRTRYRIYEYLKKGEGIFWRINKKKKALYLNSLTKICLSLKIPKVYSDSPLFNVAFMRKHFDAWNDILLAVVASKTGRPVSNINLADRCNICEKSVKNYLNEAEKIEVIARDRNFLFLASYNTKAEAQAAKIELSSSRKKNFHKLRVKEYKGKHGLFEQMPNNSICLHNKISAGQVQKDLWAAQGYAKQGQHKRQYVEKGIEQAGLEYVCSFAEKGGVLYNYGEPNVNMFIRRNEDGTVVTI